MSTPDDSSHDPDVGNADPVVTAGRLRQYADDPPALAPGQTIDYEAQRLLRLAADQIVMSHRIFLRLYTETKRPANVGLVDYVKNLEQEVISLRARDIQQRLQLERIHAAYIHCEIAGDIDDTAWDKLGDAISPREEP